MVFDLIYSQKNKVESTLNSKTKDERTLYYNCYVDITSTHYKLHFASFF